MLLQRGGALSRNCRGCSPTMRLFPASANGGYHPAPVLHRPQPPPTTVDYFDKSTTGSTSTSVFLRKMFRNSAATPASPLIRKSTTLRSTLWCSHYSVSKRQQFSYPLLIDFVAEVGKCRCRSLGLSFLVVWPIFFYCSSIDEQHS